MRWPWERQDSNERLTVSWLGQTLAYVHSLILADGTHKVLKFGVERQGTDNTEDFIFRLQALGLEGLDTRVMLRSEQYQFLQIDSPAVPAEELRSAIRYQIKDKLKGDLDDVTLDMMPVGDSQQEKTSGQLFVVAADNLMMRQTLVLADAMDWNVAVIDIQETAQRNLQSALAGLEGREGNANAALVSSDGKSIVLTISANNALFYRHQYELPEGFLVAPWEQGSSLPEEFGEPADVSQSSAWVVDDIRVGRFLAQVQRSLDIWNRSWASLPLDGMRVYAGESSENLSTRFGVEFRQTVLPMDVSGLFPEFEGGPESDKALCLPLLGVLIRSPSAHIPQEINLFTYLQSTQERPFLAQAMAQTLAVLLLLVGCLSGYWLWSMQVEGEDIKKSMAAQSRELEAVQAAIGLGEVGNNTKAALTQELQRSRTALLQRENIAQERQRGLIRSGWGHAGRLRLVAQSIPPQVWVTEIKADEAQFELRGFTLEPAVLSEWVARLADSPLLEGQKLSDVNLENSSTVTPKTGGSTTRQVWSFSLISGIPNASIASGVGL